MNLLLQRWQGVTLHHSEHNLADPIPASSTLSNQVSIMNVWSVLHFYWLGVQQLQATRLTARVSASWKAGRENRKRDNHIFDFAIPGMACLIPISMTHYLLHWKAWIELHLLCVQQTGKRQAILRCCQPVSVDDSWIWEFRKNNFSLFIFPQLLVSSH